MLLYGQPDYRAKQRNTSDLNPCQARVRLAGKRGHQGMLSVEVFDKHDIGFVAVELIIEQPAPVGR